MVTQGVAGLGEARPGLARLGKAGHGKAGDKWIRNSENPFGLMDWRPKFGRFEVEW